MPGGVLGQVGQKAEATYGTYVAPDRFYEARSGAPKLRENRAQGGGIAGGRVGYLGTRYQRTHTDGEATISLEAVNKSLGLLLAQAVGSVAAPVQQSATPAWLQTHVPTFNVQSSTVQFGVPDVDDTTVRPYTATGAVITELAGQCNIDEQLVLTPTFDAQQIVESQTLVAQSLLTGLVPYHFGMLAVRVGTFGAEVAAGGVKGVSFSIKRPMKVDRFYAGATNAKKIPVCNGQPDVGGSLDADYIDKTVFADRWASGAAMSIVYEWTGANIASTFFETLRLTFPACYLTGDTPGIAGEDVVSGSFPWVAKSDGVNPVVKIEYMSVDTAI